MKLIELIKTNLRGFLDDWKSVIVLVGLPMFIVAMIFSSFGYESLNLGIGVVDKTEDFDYNRFEDQTESFANLKNYSSEGECLSDIREFRIEACTVIVQEDNNTLKLKLRYDNTRESVGSRIETGIRSVAVSMRLNYTEETASRTIEKIREQEESITNAQDQIESSERQISDQIEFLDEKIVELQNLRKSFGGDLNRIETGLNQLNNDLKTLNTQVTSFAEVLKGNLSRTNQSLSRMTGLNSENKMRKQEALTQISEMYSSTQKLQHLPNSQEPNFNISKTRKNYLKEVNNSVKEFQNSKILLANQRQDMIELNRSLNDLKAFNSDLTDRNASSLAQPIKSDSEGLYIAKDQYGNEETSNTNLLRRQTIFSTVLVFIAIFVSLLVSQFITLKQINSSVMKRHKMIKGIFLEEYLSVFISSALIISIPIFSVLFFGYYFFQLPILKNLSSVAIVTGLLCFSLINLGIATSYLVKEKSITLLIGNLALVFLSFFSGFVLPLDMMNQYLGTMGKYQPASIALRSFDSIILYGKEIHSIQFNIFYLSLWVIFLSLICLGVKKTQNV